MHEQLNSQKVLDSKEGKRENQAKGSTGGWAGLRTSAGRWWTLSPGEWFSARSAFAPEAHSAVSGDICSRHNWTGVAPGTLQCVGQPELFRIVQIYLSQSVSQAKLTWHSVTALQRPPACVSPFRFPGRDLRDLILTRVLGLLQSIEID